MASTHFKFKQFTIRHDRTSMKVGTDAVLLGAWTQLKKAKTILDIGTGSGVIALMLAQRSGKDVVIEAVELEVHAFEQATENVRQSPWPKKVKVNHYAIQDFHPDKKYDLIVSNPPYFQNSQKPPDGKRLQTRHTDTLPFLDLINSANRLLAPNGKLNVILPYHEALSFIELAHHNKLYCSRQWGFRARKEKPIERWLLEFSTNPLTKDEGEIILYKIGEEWSDEYKLLTKDFYLKI